MRLTAFEVENFRGIGDLRLELDATTVLLGENRVGKTTLVDALEYCLGPRPAGESPFQVADLRRGVEPLAAPPICLTLTFTEQRAGDWTKAIHRFLATLRYPLEEDPNRHQVRLQMLGSSEPGGIRVGWRFLDSEGNPLPEEQDLDRVEALRDLCPCLLLAANRYTVGASQAAIPPPGLENGHDAARRVVDGVYRRVCLTRGGVSVAEIKAGLDAAHELKDEALGRDAEDRPRDLQDMLQTPRSLASLPLHEDEDSLSAQNLALLILVGSLFQALGDETLSPDASPLVVIEEPEAHLHPILAASLWGTLESLPAQQVITTNSGDLLASAPLESLRRLVRPSGETEIHQLQRNGLSLDDQRRVGYHVRIQRGASLFARCWLLVEGETESWLLPELARECGYVLASEGVFCIEFAQCGVRPLIRMANAMGIEWHLLADGDDAGKHYVRAAKRDLNGRPTSERVTSLRERDVEHCLWENGYARVFQEAAFPGQRPGKVYKRKLTKRARRRARRRGHHGPKHVIDKAISNHSKPFMALKVLEAAAEPGSRGVPAMLERAIEAAVWLARTSAGVPTSRPKTQRLSRVPSEVDEG